MPLLDVGLLYQLTGKTMPALWLPLLPYQYVDSLSCMFAFICFSFMTNLNVHVKVVHSFYFFLCPSVVANKQKLSTLTRCQLQESTCLRA